LLLNAPSLEGRAAGPACQHKYPETVMFSSPAGPDLPRVLQLLLRWAQFVDEPDLKMATDDVGTLVGYLREHPEVTSVLIIPGATP